MKLISEHDEPRVQDLNLAQHLGFENEYKIRHLIDRNWRELERFGEVLEMADKTTAQGGRPGKSYHLNRKQCLYVCAKSQTPKAAEVTILMVELFGAWLGTGKPVDVRQHKRARPMRREPEPPVRHAALPPPSPISAGFQIEPVTNTLRRFSVVTTEAVCTALAQRWMQIELNAA